MTLATMQTLTGSTLSSDSDYIPTDDASEALRHEEALRTANALGEAIVIDEGQNFVLSDAEKAAFGIKD
jgi:hypothetical protein